MTQSDSKPSQAPSPLDPDEILEGVCGTCHGVIHLPAKQASNASPGKGPGPLTRSAQSQLAGSIGAWADLPCAECPGCRARVYLHRIR